MTRLPRTAATTLVLWCLLTVAARDGSAQPRIPDKISGYGAYRFGMTIAEARRAEPSAAEIKCDYVGTASCLEQQSVFFGEQARVTALFADTDKRLNKVNITFDRLQGTEGACGKGVKTILDALFRRFGEPTKSEPRRAFWYATEGGEIHLMNMCIDDDLGLFVVSYSPSASF